MHAAAAWQCKTRERRVPALYPHPPYHLSHRVGPSMRPATQARTM